MKTSKKDWLVYIVECADNTLYTGITNNLERRINQHNTGTGAKYLKGRRPVKPVYIESGHDRSSASKRENSIKRFTRQQKIKLINYKGSSNKEF
ncbi:GIY-YIG nuclease family protein [Spartinivicinus poritis]|uniref:GIY-YIG nuclease family protein n=1 Tax=Spartinivicinus poritis TaxID=2994640 RepID=A0ABT5UB54_9GAMM|nr:GIY-YIG nuclease family protein [Spartinivicinus sp. A2-2]MDE1463597.1 GIY-YIG nuclease family protein [Spartinivicinus sp. A2-2]